MALYCFTTCGTERKETHPVANGNNDDRTGCFAFCISDVPDKFAEAGETAERI